MLSKIYYWRLAWLASGASCGLLYNSNIYMALCLWILNLNLNIDTFFTRTKYLINQIPERGYMVVKGRHLQYCLFWLQSEPFFVCLFLGGRNRKWDPIPPRPVREGPLCQSEPYFLCHRNHTCPGPCPLSIYT